MFLSADVINLLLYCVQQLGVTLGVGAQTIMLVAYLSAIRDGIIDAKEAQFARAVRTVLNVGLVLIIISGVAITAIHFMSNQESTILSAAYLFKWVLVAAVLVFTLWKGLSQPVALGLAGGTWYAFFVVHILAPVTTWANLLTLYGVWMAGFGICWAVIVISMHGKPATAVEVLVKKTYAPSAPAPKAPQPFLFTSKPAKPAAAPPPQPVAPPPPPSAPPAPPPPPAPAKAPAIAPVAPVPQQAHILQTLPQPDIEQKQSSALVKEDENPWLPAIRIMPKTPGDAQKQSPDLPAPPTPAPPSQ